MDFTSGNGLKCPKIAATKFKMKLSASFHVVHFALIMVWWVAMKFGEAKSMHISYAGAHKITTC